MDRIPIVHGMTSKIPILPRDIFIGSDLLSTMGIPHHTLGLVFWIIIILNQ